MSAHHYADALFRAVQEKDEATIDAIILRLVRYMKERGHSALLPTVVREYEILEKKREHEMVNTIRVKKFEDSNTYAELIQKDIDTLGTPSLPRTVIVDETLVGGYEVRSKGMRIDRTYKRTLLTLYNTLLTNT